MSAVFLRLYQRYSHYRRTVRITSASFNLPSTPGQLLFFKKMHFNY